CGAVFEDGVAVERTRIALLQMSIFNHAASLGPDDADDDANALVLDVDSLDEHLPNVSIRGHGGLRNGPGTGEGKQQGDGKHKFGNLSSHPVAPLHFLPQTAGATLGAGSWTWVTLETNAAVIRSATESSHDLQTLETSAGAAQESAGETSRRLVASDCWAVSLSSRERHRRQNEHPSVGGQRASDRARDSFPQEIHSRPTGIYRAKNHVG